MKRVLCIWLPTWPIQRFLVARPDLGRRAILMYARQGNRGQRIIASSAAAQAVGVRGGMPLAEATALMPQKKPFETALYDPEGDEQALTRLAEWCEKFSPIVGLEQIDTAARTGDEQAAPESLLLDVTGLGPLFGGEEALARKVMTELAARGYRARAAIADSAGAAWAVARFANHVLENHDAVAVIAPGEHSLAIAPLPLAALRLPAATIELMWALGIQRIEQLLRLPRASLSSRFGDGVLQRIDQALGNVREPIAAHRPAPEFQADWVLEYAADRRDAVEFVVRQLIVRVAHLLAEQNRGAVRLEIQLQCTPEAATTTEAGANVRSLAFRVDLFRPTTAASHLWELVRLQLDQATLPGPMEKAAVQATLTAPRESHQGELFTDLHGEGGNRRHDDQQLALLIDRLSSRLGRQQVLRPRLVADAQPERACRYLPLAGRRPLAKNTRQKKTRSPKTRSPNARSAKKLVEKEGTAADRHDAADQPNAAAVAPSVGFRPADRPLYLVHPPLPLSVMATAPDGPPARLRHRQDWHTVMRYWGPERIETGWWRGPSLRRDYYRVETDTGLWFWLFRRLDNGQWFLHGHFV